MSMERFYVDTERMKVPTGTFRYCEEAGKTVQVMTSTYSQIMLIDRKGIYEKQTFTCIEFAQKCADALNNIKRD